MISQSDTRVHYSEMKAEAGVRPGAHPLGGEDFRTKLAFVPDLIHHGVEHPALPEFLPGHQGRPIRANGDFEIPSQVTKHDRAHIEAIAAPRRRLNAKATWLYSQADADPEPRGSVVVLTGGGTGANYYALKALLGGPKREMRPVFFSANSHACVPSTLADIHGVYARRLTPRLHLHGAQLPASPDDIAAVLKAHPDTSAIVVTTPTIGGLYADVKKIARIVHTHNEVRRTQHNDNVDVLFHVDQAWGPHSQNINDAALSGVATSALLNGADSFATSLHKSLDGAMGQSAVAGVRNDVDLVERFKNTVNRLDTTSPSSIILASADIALAQPKLKLIALVESVCALRSDVRKIPDVFILDDESDHHASDPAKLTFRVNGLYNGEELLSRLEHQGVRTILHDGEYATMHFTIPCNSDRRAKIVQAVKNVVNEVKTSSTREFPIPTFRKASSSSEMFPELQQALEGYELKDYRLVRVALEQSVGRICTEVISAVPPGIAIAFQGQRMDEHGLAAIKCWQKVPGIHMRGISDDGTIGVTDI